MLVKRWGWIKLMRSCEVRARDIADLSDRGSIVRSRSHSIRASFSEFDPETGTAYYDVSSQGGSGSYTVAFRFKGWRYDAENMDDEIQHALKGDIEIDCTCPAFSYQGYRYLATLRGGSIDEETRAPNIRNIDRKGYACKHILKALDSFVRDFDWFREDARRRS